MLHPSYADLIKVVNSGVEEGEDPVVSSRYSIVMATSKRARQIIAGDDELVDGRGKKPLSVAVEELNEGKIRILTDESEEETEEVPTAETEAAETQESAETQETEEAQEADAPDGE
ncbi:MAG: DNA-directed RNA polymerase subunit omega [Lachnospiraceae bacterium]|jgi:DNA-directed RNA polymerase subunit omega